jgi:DNA primase
MTIPRSVVDEIRARTDIAEVIGRTVTLKRQGRSWVGLCPFHSDRKPSFSVVPEKGIYYCFPCGEGGDVFRFLMKTRGISFIEAVKELAGPAGITIEEREPTPEERRRAAMQADLHDVCEAAARLFHTTLLTSSEGAPGRDYLDQRGITFETAQKYRLGYAPEGWDRLANHLHKQRIPLELGVKAGLLKRNENRNSTYDVFRDRVIFPILDDRGRVVAFGGRILPGKDDRGPKYLNSPESEIYKKKKTLYGLSWARTSVQRKDRVILVEGYFDAVSLWQAGFEEAVATCGTALTPEHLEIIRRLTRKVVALFDSDEAGQRAAAHALDLFLPIGVEGRRLDLRDAKDPDEFIQRHGAEAFEAQLQHTEPLVELVVRRVIAREGPTAEGRVRAVAALAPTLRQLPDLLRTQMISRAAGLLGIHESQLIDALGAAPAPETPTPAPTSAPPTRWIPSRDLAHLMWLTIHFPARVAPVLADSDPDVISDRRDVLEALAHLAAGRALPEVTADCADPDLARTLLWIAARPAEYTEETAQSSATRLLAKMELDRVEAQILTIKAQIAACETSGDKSSYGVLASQMLALITRRNQLHAAVRRPR